MIPTIGLIVAVYCVCRLFLVPCEMQNGFGQVSVLGIIVAVIGCLIIAFLAIDLMMSAGQAIQKM